MPVILRLNPQQRSLILLFTFSQCRGDIFQTLVFRDRGGAVFALNPLVNLFAVDGNVLRGFDAQLDMPAIEVDNFYGDVITDTYGFAEFSC